MKKRRIYRGHLNIQPFNQEKKMNKLFYISLLALGLTACNGTVAKQEAVKKEKSTIQVETDRAGSFVKNVASELATGYIDKKGKVYVQMNEANADAFAEKNKIPNRVGNAILEVVGLNHKCKDIVFFGKDEERFLGMLTEEGEFAFLDLKKCISIGDSRGSDVLPEIKNAQSISVKDDWVSIMTQNGEETIHPFHLPGHYMYNDFEIFLTKDYRISFFSESAGFAKSGTFFIDHSMDADGPDSASQTLVCNIENKTYKITFGYDHFKLADNDEKRNDYTFNFETDDFALTKGQDITFRRYESSQIAN